jgi:hypothetical protein
MATKRVGNQLEFWVKIEGDWKIIIPMTKQDQEPMNKSIQEE